MNDSERVALVKKVFEERLQMFKNARRDPMRNGVKEPRDVEAHFNARMNELNARLFECQDVIEWLGVLAARSDSPQSS